MILTCYNSILILLQKNVCLEHFIAEWNQCFSRIFLYRCYWDYASWLRLRMQCMRRRQCHQAFLSALLPRWRVQECYAPVRWRQDGFWRRCERYRDRVPGHQYRARDKRTEGNRDCPVGRHQQRARYLPSWIGTRTTLLASHRNHMISLVLAFVGPPMAVLGHGEVTRSEWALLSDSATQSTSALALPLWKSRASGAQRAATAPTSAGAMW